MFDTNTCNQRVNKKMITTARFISLNIKYGDTIETEFINKDHILRFYLDDDNDIVVLLANGTNLLVTGTSIFDLLDKLNNSN